MAVSSLVHSLNITHHTNPFPHNKASPRSKLSQSCRSQLTSGPSGDSEEEEKHRERKQGKGWYKVTKLCGEATERVRESMSPKRKGDWKDVVLMSLSFAVYVYISQKIVCTYCAWVSLLKHLQ